MRKKVKVIFKTIAITIFIFFTVIFIRWGVNMIPDNIQLGIAIIIMFLGIFYIFKMVSNEVEHNE